MTHRRLRLSRVATTLALTLAVALPLLPLQAQAVPNGLPSHFAFGVSAGQGDTWMPQTGLPWDYRYQYLVGGVNTGSGWETWNANGTFALNYAQESAQHGYIPVFPYYELLQSNGSCGGCNENQKDLSNLNNAGLMQAYYQNFALLMKRLGPGSYDGIQGFGKTAVINLEPDFTGGYAVQAVNNTNGACFGFCTGQANDPTLLRAAVASSGDPDVAAYPNTYAGFIQALAHLRDQYAPNVVLGLHASPWATGDDIGTDPSPNVDAAGLGRSVGSFLSQSGPHEVLFSDPLDRDAGQYQALYGQNRWWDRLNVTFPNFHRWEQYLQGLTSGDGGKSMLLWQVPVGNQYFDTENNTNGHYQDNRAEYIFGHISELMQAGVSGVLFGPGNAGSTSYTDTMHDGVTNPAPFCTTDGTSSGQVCNTHVSSVADDDGGYVRMSAQAYYQNPIALGGGGGPAPTATATPTGLPAATSTPAPTATATATVVAGTPGFTSSASAAPGTVAPGQTVTLTTSVTSGTATTSLVDLEIYDAASHKVFQQFWDNQTFTPGQPLVLSTTWQVPAAAAQGAYTLMVGTFSPGWGTLYSWNGSAGYVSVAAAAATSTPTPLATNTPQPTATATAPATATATATATTAPVQPQFNVTTSVSPPLVHNTTTSINVSVTSSAATAILLDVEVWGPGGTRVLQQVWDNQSFAAGQTRTFSISQFVPAGTPTGVYSVQYGIFVPGWGARYVWNADAATITVN